MKTTPHVFKTFPEFSELTLADRGRYEKLIAHFPPISEYSFPTLINQWSVLHQCKVAQLNGNLVLMYWLPGLEEIAGLSVLGSKKIDESVAEIMDWLRANDQPRRLVHVSEFVVSSMKYPELYGFEQEREYDECVIPVANLAALGTMIQHKRWKVRRFLSMVHTDRVIVKSLDLIYSQNQQILLDAVVGWRDKGLLNNLGASEEEAMRFAIKNAEDVGLENVCVYIDGVLHGFSLFQFASDPKFVIINFARFSYAMPHIFEFVAHKFGEFFATQGIEFANIDADLGIPALRAVKLALGPTNFFRKYTITPGK